MRIRKTIMVLMLVLSVLFSGMAFSEAKNVNESILFRGIPWDTTEKELEEKMTHVSNARLNPFTPSYTIADSWFLPTSYYSLSDNYIENGCQMLLYSSVPVAGYNTTLILYCIYPIVDGEIKKDVETTEFYMARYIFDSDDFEGLDSIYDDLLDKLSSVYGESEEKGNGKSNIGRVWYAADGSVLWLNKFLYGGKSNTVMITYCEPNIDDRLIALKQQIAQEKLEKEELERQQNTNNTDGL